MNQPLSYHLDKDGVALTPKEAASKALSLRHLYSNPQLFTMKLEEYLKEKGAAQEETDAVVGMQQLNVIREMKAKKGKDKEAAGPSSSTSNASVSRTSGSRGSQQAVTPSTSLQSSVLSGVQQHQIPPQHLPATITIQHDPPPPPHAHPHQADSIDINDEASWKLLEQFLQR